eukprot:1756351-Amphidinium_carterae.1
MICAVSGFCEKHLGGASKLRQFTADSLRVFLGCCNLLVVHCTLVGKALKPPTDIIEALPLRSGEILDCLHVGPHSPPIKLVRCFMCAGSSTFCIFSCCFKLGPSR